VLVEALERLPALGYGPGRVQRRGLAGVRLLDRLDLVALEGDERRDDDRRPVDEQRGDLVDGRLARARRHDNERVAAADDRLGRLELRRAQLETERLARLGLNQRLPARNRHTGDGNGHPWLVIALYIIVTATAVFSVLFVLVLFVWAARKDGEADRAVRAKTDRRR
jgi:hypothetical protein